MKQYIEYSFNKVYKIQREDMRLWQESFNLSKKDRYKALGVYGVYGGGKKDPEC